MTKTNLHDADETAHALRAIADLLVLLSVAPRLDVETKRKALRCALEVLRVTSDELVTLLLDTQLSQLSVILNLSDSDFTDEGAIDPHAKVRS